MKYPTSDLHCPRCRVEYVMPDGSQHVAESLCGEGLCIEVPDEAEGCVYSCDERGEVVSQVDEIQPCHQEDHEEDHQEDHEEDHDASQTRLPEEGEPEPAADSEGSQEKAPEDEPAKEVAEDEEWKPIDHEWPAPADVFPDESDKD